MTRKEFVRLLVLNAICDDGENVDQIILGDVNRDADKTRVTINRAEVIAALAGLVEDGLASAHLPNAKGFLAEVQGMPPIDEIENGDTLETFFKTYFFITEKGMELHLSDDIWYPFDADGNLRPDWHLDG